MNNGTKFALSLLVFGASIILVVFSSGYLAEAQNILTWTFCVIAWVLFLVSSFYAFVKDLD